LSDALFGLKNVKGAVLVFWAAMFWSRYLFGTGLAQTLIEIENTLKQEKNNE